MAKSITYDTLAASLRSAKPAPVYVLHGEEGYFTDQAVRAFENLLPEEDREFNQYVLYGPQTSPEEIVDACRRCPMMAPYQVVIVKEMQQMTANQADKLAAYMEKPSETTVLVLAWRGEKAKGAKFLAALKKNNDAAVMESMRIYENALPGHITRFLNSRGLNVQPKAQDMLAQYIGTDLSRMYNELAKLCEILGSGATVTPEAVERHIGVSKDFNAFEMVDALASKNMQAAMRIAAYFRANPKAVPPPMLTGAIFTFFSDLLVSWFVQDKSDANLGRVLNTRNPHALRRLATGRSKYNAYQAIEVIRVIRNFDTRSKGVGSRRNVYDLLDEMVFHILTAPGNLSANP